MTVVCSPREYQRAKEHMGTEISRYYDDTGVKHIVMNLAGGCPTWSIKTTNWGEKTEIKECPSCGQFHDKHNPPLCFSCAVGLN